MRNINFNIGFSPGDNVVFTRALTDLCVQYPDININIKSCCLAIYENNPHIYKKIPPKEPIVVPIAKITTDYQSIFREMIKKNELIAENRDGTWYYSKDGLDLFYCKQKEKPKPKVESYDIHYEDIHNSGVSGRHFSQAFFIELEKHLKVKIKQTSLLPALFLSDEEKSWANQVEQEFGYRGKFWLICAGHKNDYILKQWGFDNWQKLIDLLSDKIQFVQIGELGSNHHHPELKGVFNLLGKTDLRQLIRLSWHMQGAVSHVSLLHHLAAAWQKPCVTIAGGREPRRWESYPHMRYLDTNGQLDCCAYDGCWMSGRQEENENKTCKNLVGLKPECMATIKPERVAEEIMNYKYFGGDTSK